MRRCILWNKGQQSGVWYTWTSKTREFIESKQKDGGVKIYDISFVAPTAPDGEVDYATLWEGTEVKTVATLAVPIEQHSAQCSTLISSGYRPISIDAKHDAGGQVLVASIWRLVP